MLWIISRRTGIHNVTYELKNATLSRKHFNVRLLDTHINLASSECDMSAGQRAVTRGCTISGMERVISSDIHTRISESLAYMCHTFMTCFDA